MLGAVGQREGQWELVFNGGRVLISEGEKYERQVMVRIA